MIVERGGDPRFDGPLRSLQKIVDAEPVLSETMIGILREEAAEVVEIDGDNYTVRGACFLGETPARCNASHA